jgi:Tol biopolymer transport system component
MGHQQRGQVFAYKPELDAWWNSRRSDLEAEALETSSAQIELRPRRKIILWTSVAAVALLGGLALWRFAGRAPAAPALALKAVPLTSYPGNEMWPAFSPDGARIAFTWNGEDQGNSDIYVRPLHTEPPLRLTTDPRADQQPVWSPDGRTIAFLRSSLGTTDEIYTVPATGGAERKLAGIHTVLVSDLPFPYMAWTPDGRWIFAPDKGSASEPYSLVLLSPDDGEKRRLTAPPAQSLGDTAPALSPDGRTLAFVRCSTAFVCGLYLQPLFPDFTAKETPKRLVAEEEAAIFSPMWAAGGREILYVREQADIPTLWHVPVSGGRPPETVTSTGNLGHHVTLSSAGDKLAYSDFVHDRNLYRLSLDDSGRIQGDPLQLTTSNRIDQGARISPDGARMAFISYRTGSPELWLSDAEGKNETQLTHLGGPMTSSPRWSPDGREIAFDARVGGHGGIFVIPAAGGKPRPLSPASVQDSGPSWSRDGKWIYFASNRSGGFQIWKVPAAGGDAAQLTKRGGYGGLESLDGKYLYYAKEYGYGGTTLWRVPNTGGSEEQIAGNLWSRDNFEVAEEGIYFTHTWIPGTGHPVCLFRFATNQAEQLGVIDRPVSLGLTIWPPSHPDRLVYSIIEKAHGDLMLIENFRQR